MVSYSSCDAGSMRRTVVVILLLGFLLVGSCSAFLPVGCSHQRRSSIEKSFYFTGYLKQMHIPLTSHKKEICFLREGTRKSDLLLSLQSRKNVGLNIPHGFLYTKRDHNCAALRNNGLSDVSLPCHSGSQGNRWRRLFKQIMAKCQKRLTTKIVSMKRISRFKISAPVAVAVLCFISSNMIICPQSAFAADSAAATTLTSRRFNLWKSAEPAFRILYAAVLGSALGLERTTSSQKAGAGVRTMALVSLGACVFGMCGTHGFATRLPEEVAKFHPSPSEVLVSEAVDASRMASGVATGVGFLGAGIISNNRRPDGTYDKDSSVRALATAATIWVSSAVGVSAGAGLYIFALAMTLVTVVTLRMGEYVNPPDIPTPSSSEKMTRSPPSSSSSKSREDAQATESTPAQPLEEKLWRFKENEKGTTNMDVSLPITDDISASVPIDKTAATSSTLVKSKATKAVDPLLERVWKREEPLLSEENAEESVPLSSEAASSGSEAFQQYEAVQENMSKEILTKENKDESETASMSKADLISNIPPGNMDSDDDDPYDFELDCSASSGLLSNNVERNNKARTNEHSDSSNDSSLASILRCIEDNESPNKSIQRNNSAHEIRPMLRNFSSFNKSKQKSRKKCQGDQQYYEREKLNSGDFETTTSFPHSMETKRRNELKVQQDDDNTLSNVKARNKSSENRSDHSQSSNTSSLASILRCIEDDKQLRESLQSNNTSSQKKNSLLNLPSCRNVEENDKAGKLTDTARNENLLNLAGSEEYNDANRPEEVGEEENDLIGHTSEPSYRVEDNVIGIDNSSLIKGKDLCFVKTENIEVVKVERMETKRTLWGHEDYNIQMDEKVEVTLNDDEETRESSAHKKTVNDNKGPHTNLMKRSLWSEEHNGDDIIDISENVHFINNGRDTSDTKDILSESKVQDVSENYDNSFYSATSSSYSRPPQEVNCDTLDIKLNTKDIECKMSEEKGNIEDSHIKLEIYETRTQCPSEPTRLPQNHESNISVDEIACSFMSNVGIELERGNEENSTNSFRDDDSSIAEDDILDESSATTSLESKKKNAKFVESNYSDDNNISDMLRFEAKNDPPNPQRQSKAILTAERKDDSINRYPMMAVNADRGKDDEEKSENSYSDDDFDEEGEGEGEGNKEGEEQRVSMSQRQRVEESESEENDSWNEIDEAKDAALEKSVGRSASSCHGSHLSSPDSQSSCINTRSRRKGSNSKNEEQKMTIRNANIQSVTPQKSLTKNIKSVDKNGNYIVATSTDHIDNCINANDTTKNIGGIYVKKMENQTKDCVAKKDASTQSTGNDAGIQVNLSPKSMDGTKCLFDKSARDPVSYEKNVFPTEISECVKSTETRLGHASPTISGSHERLPKRNECSTIWHVPVQTQGYNSASLLDQLSVCSKMDPKSDYVSPEKSFINVHQIRNKHKRKQCYSSSPGSSCVASEPLKESHTPYDILKPLFQGQQDVLIKRAILQVKEKQNARIKNDTGIELLRGGRNRLQFWEALIKVDPQLSVAEAKRIAAEG